MNKANRKIAWLLIIIGLLILNACQSGSASKTPSPNATGNGTSTATRTPTPAPLGSAKNPLKMAVVIDPTNIDPNMMPDEIEASASHLAQLLSQKSGYQIKSQVFSNYDDLIAALQKRSVHIAWLPPLTYLLASKNNAARAALLSNHYGVYQYGTQFLANTNSNFTSYIDPATGKNTADASTALAQFKGLRPCWVDLTSPSGYILPAGILAGQQIDTQPGTVMQSHTAVVRGLYVKGICDFGAVYTTMGDPRTSINDLPYLNDQVIPIWQSDPVIPNLNISYIPEMPAKMVGTLNKTFQDLVKTEQGKSLMILTNNNYDIQDLQEVKEGTYVALISAIQDLKIDLKTLLGK